MRNLVTLFIPHEDNGYRPPILHHKSLLVILVTLLTLEFNFNLFYSTDPSVLGFATNIYQEKLIDLTNKERGKENLPALRESADLDKAARLKAVDMFADGYWAHTAPDGTTPWVWFDVVGYDYLMAGENLAKDFDTSAGVVSGWLASPSHRDNLLNKDFTEIGMAVVNGRISGEETTLVVQLFGTPAPTPGSSTAFVAGTTPEAYPESADKPAPLPVPESVTAVINQGERLTPAGIPAQALSRFEQLRLFASVAVRPSSWGIGQKLLIAVFTALTALFIVDSFIIWREGITRKNSHSLIHAGILGILILGVIYSNFGLVL